MITYRYNEHTMTHFKYDSDYYDFLTPMFDEELHRGEVPCALERTTCAYCQTEFESRNKLFYHLGYMNINIRRSKNKDHDFGLLQQSKKRKIGQIHTFCKQLRKRLKI